MILSIDTTSENGSIALVADQGVVEEVALHSPEGFSYILFQEIEALLARHSVELSALEGFAVAAGPGSFTGVRDLNLVQPEGVASLDEWLARLQAEGDLEIITNLEIGQPFDRDDHIVVTKLPTVISGSVGLVAMARFRSGGGEDPANIDANYIRRSDAELAWTDARSGPRLDLSRG